MKITFLTAHIGIDFAYIGEMNKKEYCLNQGYKFVCRKDGFDETRLPSWSKIKFAKELLPDCDWLFWSDADALVTNYSTRLETFIDPDYDLLITHDDNGMNGGHFFLKNSPWSFNFLDRVWDWPVRNHHWAEQWAMMQLAELEGFKERIKILPTTTFNGYPSPGHSWPDLNDCWKPGDFIVHFPGTEETAPQAWGKPKVRLMEEYYYKRV